MRPAREEHLGRGHSRHCAERQPEDTPEETAATRPIHPSRPWLNLGDPVARVKTDGLGTGPVPRRTPLDGQLPTVWLLCPRSSRLAVPWESLRDDTLRVYRTCAAACGWHPPCSRAGPLWPINWTVNRTRNPLGLTNVRDSRRRRHDTTSSVENSNRLRRATPDRRELCDRGR